MNAAQRSLYRALAEADPGHLAIVREILTAHTAGADPMPSPEDLGAPVDTTEWAEIVVAVETFEHAIGGGDEAATVRAALEVVNNTIGEKT